MGRVSVGAVIRLENLIKDYGRLRALDGVSLSMGGGITGLLGPNGAGKTTLIKVLLGLLKISSGQGHVLGHDLHHEARTIRGLVGFMPEDDCYIPGLSGVEVVQFGARLSGQPAIEGLRRAHEILDFCGIEQERYRHVDTYSTGMRQKLKFAQAIVHDPPLLILDEPTAGLDPEERQSMLNRIQILAREHKKAVLLSTHILPDVQAVCEWVIIVVRGRVRLEESLEVLRRPASPSLHVRTVGSAQPLVARIQRENVGFRIEEDGGVTIEAVDPDAVDRVWRWACEAGVGIRSLQPARNSLEQVFVDAVREDAHAAS